jgi:hypothetical protein
MDAHDSHAAAQIQSSFTNGFLFSLVARETTMDPETPTATAATNKAMTALAAQDKLVDKLVA